MNNLNSYMTFDFEEEDYIDDFIPCDIELPWLEEEDYLIDYQSQFIFLWLLFFVVLGIPILFNELTSSKS